MSALELFAKTTAVASGLAVALVFFGVLAALAARRGWLDTARPAKPAKREVDERLN